ncbi:MAG: DUF393 domain-containing protein [bacterium]|nr:DUF393 domain-containing protein [bacterium]
MTGAPRELALTVYFDGDCGFCRRVADWLRDRPRYVPIHLVAAQRAAATGCPFDLQSLLAQVTVVASDGAVYRGTNAWLVVLWGLRDYRGWSLRLAADNRRKWAERLFAVITGLASLTKTRPAGN